MILPICLFLKVAKDCTTRESTNLASALHLTPSTLSNEKCKEPIKISSQSLETSEVNYHQCFSLNIGTAFIFGG